MDAFRKMKSLFVDITFDLNLEKILASENESQCISNEEFQVILNALNELDDQTTMEKACELIQERARQIKGLSVNQKIKLLNFYDFLFDNNFLWQRDYFFWDQQILINQEDLHSQSSYNFNNIQNQQNKVYQQQSQQFQSQDSQNFIFLQVQYQYLLQKKINTSKLIILSRYQTRNLDLEIFMTDLKEIKDFVREVKSFLNSQQQLFIRQSQTFIHLFQQIGFNVTQTLLALLTITYCLISLKFLEIIDSKNFQYIKDTINLIEICEDSFQLIKIISDSIQLKQSFLHTKESKIKEACKIINQQSDKINYTAKIKNLLINNQNLQYLEYNQFQEISLLLLKISTIYFSIWKDNKFATPVIILAFQSYYKEVQQKINPKILKKLEFNYLETSDSDFNEFKNVLSPKTDLIYQ